MTPNLQEVLHSFLMLSFFSLIFKINKIKKTGLSIQSSNPKDFSRTNFSLHIGFQMQELLFFMGSLRKRHLQL